jgi:ABC-type multidrug transport system fused ATPase/permease subunit
MITVPQDPFVLSGSVRPNADPIGIVPDDTIINDLPKFRLRPIIQARGGLDADLTQQPLSHGQQQLLCLGRAILKQSKILILDEATSNVDSETDQMMQRIIREEFQNYTIITVAHRLDTIMDSDRIAVLESGVLLVEFDSPKLLLERDSAFKNLYGG